MTKEKWYWKGNGVYNKDQLKKIMKEDINHQNKTTLADTFKKTKKLKDEFFQYCDTIFKKENE
tara:strand:+ start:647 stop:835 length:189 start_codon:yes stop_codon:yes gene_type:complete